MTARLHALLGLLRHTLLDQHLNDVHSPVKRLPILIRDVHTAIKPSTTLRSGIKPLKPISLPKYTDIATIYVRARWVLGGETTENGLELIDESIGVRGDFDVLGRVRLQGRSTILADCGGEEDGGGIRRWVKSEIMNRRGSGRGEATGDALEICQYS